MLGKERIENPENVCIELRWLGKSFRVTGDNRKRDPVSERVAGQLIEGGVHRISH
jgi:hypothetical protein